MPDHPPLPSAGPTAATLTRRTLLGLASVPLLGALGACGGQGSDSGGDAGAGADTGADTDAGAGAGSATGDATTATASFVHPGLLHTEADFDRMRQKLAAGEEPWVSGWNALAASSRAKLGVTPTPLETVVRGGDGENFRTMVEQMLRAYQHALRWKVSGDTAYADEAVALLDAWSSTLKTVTGNADRFLAAGLYGYQWANAAEIMRTYPGWSAQGIARFQKMLLEVFYPLSHDFLLNHNGATITNYWANWDLISMIGIASTAVFCDRRDLYDEALAYYKNGRGNGAAAHGVYMLHPGHLGQWQEAGRDQGHATLSIAMNAMLCETAWNQGDDLYGYDNNRFLAGAEYVAQVNTPLADGTFAEMPFARYVNRQGTFTAVSTAGLPHGRPCWESIYNHYVNRRGIAAPHVSAIAAKLRPEKDQWVGDHPSMGTLTFSRDPIAAGAPPSGLVAHITGGAVLLSWWGTAYATGYDVERSAAPSGPYTAIAHVTDRLTYTDVPGDGVWYYRVTASTDAGPVVGMDTVRAALPIELCAQLPLDGTADDAGGQHRHGALMGGADWGAGRLSGSALALDGTSGHLALPTGVLQDLGDFTIAVWVYWNAAVTHARIFDFGSSEVAYMALEPRDGQGLLRFMVTGTHYYGEQTVTAASALPTGRWVHLAVTLRGRLATLYVDGSVAGTNAEVDLAPFQLGATTRNWLGRSQYAADPYFNGRMQDFRIYSGALDATQIAALAA